MILLILLKKRTLIFKVKRASTVQPMEFQKFQYNYPKFSSNNNKSSNKNNNNINSSSYKNKNSNRSNNNNK